MTRSAHSLRSRIFFWLGLFCLLTVSFASAKPVQVLMMGHYNSREYEPWWPKFKKACAAQGVEVNLLYTDTKNGLDYDKYPLDVLKQFDVVVFGGIPFKTSNTQASEEEIATFRDNLDAFYRAGGGIIWVPNAFNQWADIWNKNVGSRYDVQSLPEDIYDPAKTVDINPIFNKRFYRYIWTTNVVAHPVTEAVKGLLLPVLGEWSWPGTVPMKYGKSWQPVISGMESTSTILNGATPESGRPDFKPELKGSYASSPQIVGARDQVDGNGGRMVILPFHTTHLWKNFNHFAFNDAMMLRGDGTHPSDGLRLFINACKWLAEPAEKAGLGGYVPPQRTVSPSLQALDWSTASFPGTSWTGLGAFWQDTKQIEMPLTADRANAQDLRGLFGVRTEASDGKGTVAEYVAEAKKLGLSYLVFLENLEKTDDARFDKLVADCKANTNQDFVAIPGYIYRDLGGNLQYSFSVSKLPAKENMNADRRVIAPNNIVEQNAWANGEGIAELAKLKVDLAYLFLFTTIAPFVYEDGKLVDDGLAKYIYSEGLGHIYTPVSLTIVKSPQELATVVKDCHVTVAHLESTSEIVGTFDRGAPHPAPVYLTNGPIVQRWGALNPLGHPFWPGKNRVQFALEASSEAGIADVKIIDCVTGQPFRHFKPDGAKTVAYSIDDEHKLQRYLVAIVTDINGRTAVTSGLTTYQDGQRVWMMGDRLMGLHHGMSWDADRKKLMKTEGWLGHPWTKPYWRGGSAPDSPRVSETKIQGLDGGAVSPAAMDLGPEVVTSAGTEPKVAAYRFKNSLASFDYTVMDFLGDSQFLVNKRNEKLVEGWWSTPDPQVPNEIADINSRTWTVRSRYNADLSSNVHEITVTFKKAVRWDKLRLAGFRSGNEKVYPLLLLKDREGEFAFQGNAAEPTVREGILDTGNYYFPSGYRGGAVGVVNLGPEPITYKSDGMSSSIFVNGGGREMKAGDKVVVRFVSFVHPWQGQMNNAWIKRFIADFGIGVKPGYAYEVTQGKLRGTTYSLDIDAAKGGATVKIGKYDLPHNLVVRVFGLSDNAILGRYDVQTKQLLTLPAFEGSANTSVRTNDKDTTLYIGELFHCSDTAVALSAVQSAADELLLEVHNPTDKARQVKLTAVPGFKPLAGLQKTVDVKPFSSEKLKLSTTKGTLDYSPFLGD